MIVVDSSVLIGFLRGHSSPAIARFQEVERAEVPFSLPGVCFQEVLQGAKDLREWRLLSEYLGNLELLVAPDPIATHREAARIYFDCRRKGLTICSPVDCFLAQLVLEAGGTLLHDDDDFDRIARVRPLKAIRS